MLDWEAVNEFRRHALNPEHPVLRGTAQNGDIFFQAREACNKYYDAIPETVVDYMNKVNDKIGTDYKPFNYYGAPDAEKVIIAMGSVCDHRRSCRLPEAAGEKVGLVKVHLYRPFVAKYLLDVIPETVKTISVLDRTRSLALSASRCTWTFWLLSTARSSAVLRFHRSLRPRLQGYHSG